MEKINLEEILEKEITKIYLGYTKNSEFSYRDRVIAKNAMKEACKQALELAAKEAVIEYDRDAVIGVDQQSIHNVINLIE